MEKKNCKNRVKILAFLWILILVISGAHGIMVHRFTLAETVSNASDLNKLSIDEIVSKSRYNSCDYGIVTPNVDQGDTNICWAYSTAGASETSILHDQLDNNTNQSLRFSPNQIAYRTFNRDPDPLNNTSGVYASDKWNVMGNPTNTFLMLSQWCAPVSGSVSAKVNAYENCLYRLLDAETVDSGYTGTYRINEIKKAIAKYGAVTGSYYNAREVQYYNTKGETRDGIAHAITIVGWDDTIPASNFQPKTASIDGGWIIKNSYNSCPYFYLSYDSLVGNVCGFKYATKSEFDYNYFYDNVSEEPMRSENNSKCVANVFLAKKGSGSYGEFVKAVNVATYGNGITCKVRVYTNLTDKTNPESGMLVARGERTIDYGGYHTILLDNLAKIEKGTYYSVIVSLENPSGGSAYILYSLNTSDNTRYKSASGWNKSNYASRIKAYTVLQNDTKTDISLANINDIKPQLFTGQAICPKVIISFDGQSLIENTDYVLSYEKNTNVGRGKVKVVGIGKYSGEVLVEFEILPIDVPVRPSNEIVVSSSATKLSDIELPEGWEWLNPDELLSGISSATAVYVGTNKENYKNTSMVVALNKDSAGNKPSIPEQNKTGDDTQTNSNNQGDSDGEKPSENTNVIVRVLLVIGVVVIAILPVVLHVIKVRYFKKNRK